MARPEELGTLTKDNEFSWIAVAFSKDEKLGDDLIFPCTNDPDEKLVIITTIFMLNFLMTIFIRFKFIKSYNNLTNCRLQKVQYGTWIIRKKNFL